MPKAGMLDEVPTTALLIRKEVGAVADQDMTGWGWRCQVRTLKRWRCVFLIYSYIRAAAYVRALAIGSRGWVEVVDRKATTELDSIYFTRRAAFCRLLRCLMQKSFDVCFVRVFRSPSKTPVAITFQEASKPVMRQRSTNSKTPC
jgi:hypothetical protein